MAAAANGHAGTVDALLQPEFSPREQILYQACICGTAEPDPAGSADPEAPEVVAEHKQHTDLLRGLYDSKLRSLIAKFSSRFITGAVAAEDMRNKGSVAQLFQTSQPRASAASTALSAIGSQMTAAEFAAGLDSPYIARNNEQHVNTDEQLEAEFRSMRKAGVVKLMADEMPFECMIVKNYEVFLGLLSR